MKYKLLCICLFSLFLFSSSAPAQSQLRPAKIDKAEDIETPIQNLFQRESIFDKTLAIAPTTINFDDVPWNTNWVPISPNRYPNVTFYAPFSNALTATLGNVAGEGLSVPNYLGVVAPNGNSWAIPLSPMHIDFAHNMKNVSFYVAFGANCNFVNVEVYQNGIYFQTVPIVWSANELGRGNWLI
ncbi:MAG: hypothetical protein M3384_10315 [Acidobacteriota bacterium]|nr:hypothetical protein [Acidobacteriota bacterium]